MGAAKKINYKKVLRDLVPINALSESHIVEVTKKAFIEDVRSGRYVFRKGDRDYQSVYLLDGTVELIAGAQEVVSTIEAGSEDALHPLAHKQPRQLSARASGKVTVARIDSRLLDVLLTWDESAGYDVVEIDAHDDDDWMTRMLQSQAFLQLPPSNIHQLLMRLESVDVEAGDVVIRQGEDGDYFYIVKNGRLKVARKASSKGKEVVLAELGEGACFGEEALISETKRNASVTMITDGLLMRLSKEDFNELLRAPLVHEADFDKAQELVSKGAQWLDVRLPGEFENRAIRGSANLPLSALRDQSADLDSDTTYIVCCDTGRRSAAGAFVLSQRGFTVYALKNGLMDVPDEVLVSTSAEEPATHKVKDAEIIPFDAENKPPAAAVEAQAHEPARSSAAESEQIDKLQAQLQSKEQQIVEQARAAQQEKARLQADLDTTKRTLESSRKQLERIEGKNKSLQEDLNGVQKKMAQTRASADDQGSALRDELSQMAKRLDQQQQAHDKQNAELEQGLDKLRGDYAQLEQRNSALTDERDAAVADLQAQLTASEQKTQEFEQSLQAAGEREQSLLAQLEQAEQNNADELQHWQTEASNQLAELKEGSASLQLQLEEQHSRLEQQQSEREELEQKLKETQQSLEQATERARHMEEKLEQGEGSSGQVQKALEQSVADADQLREQLDRANQQYKESEKQVSQLKSRLSSVEKEHASDIASLREAVTRAQDERENVTREQTRLMGALRKAERDLERANQDNETEVYRLQKELKEAAGESSAGLVSLQEQLKQEEQRRDELEIQLGERGAQLEKTLAEVETLGQQLKLAQDSARQAEQQLIETNQAANEEMTARLDAEQKAQQGLREQLETITLERNQSQEQLTVQNHELEELRDAVKAAQVSGAQQSAQVAAQKEQELQTLRESVQQLQQARDEARSLQQRTQQEVDQLRAEAEVSRGLETMQASKGHSDEALHAELMEGKKNVEVAVRLRIQAEEKVAELQQQVERLQREQNRPSSMDSQDGQGVPIPFQDGDEPSVSVPLDSEFDGHKDAAQSDKSDNSLSANAPVSPFEMEASETKKNAGSRVLLIMLFALVLAAAAAYWWFGQNSAAEKSSAADAMNTSTAETPPMDSPPAAVDKAEKVEPVLAEERPKESVERPKTIPSFVKGMSDTIIPGSTKKTIDTESAEPPTAAPVEQKVVEEPAEKVEEKVVAPPRVQQPLRSFSEALESGGTGPTMVEFQADSFEMGSSSASANFAERPRHRVKLKRFAMGKYEVTFDEYDQFAQATGRLQPSSGGWGRGNRPVIHVSWKDAVAYTRWLSEQTGNRYRLPTEAEWEYVARSGSDGLFWWGNEVGEASANCYDCASEWSGNKTAPVGSFSASAFAVHDMAGNVMEWVQDCYRSGYAQAPDDGSAVELDGCAERVVRGGGYASPADLLRSASRSRRAPESRLDDLGFRVVREF